MRGRKAILQSAMGASSQAICSREGRRPAMQAFGPPRPKGGERVGGGWGARRAWAKAMRDPADDRGVIIAVDVGGSSIAGGLVTPHGDVLSHARRRTGGGEGGDPVERLLDVVAEVYAEARQQGITVQGVGVGLPSIGERG